VDDLGEGMQTTRLNPESVAPPIGSYSHAVRVETGDAVWIHVSGQIALDPQGNLVGAGDLAAQTQQVFQNLERILEASEATFADVVKIQTYLTTLEVRGRYISGDPPASTAVRVSELLFPGALIEVDVVAVVPA
jgi:enamine deaminase RidA (YjgF/YER057c/UK114 family)